MVPDLEKAASDCLSSGRRQHHAIKIIESMNKLKHVQELPTCISDIEALIPDLEKVIADFKAGNYEQALTDGLAMLPDAEKAYSDCLSSDKKFVGKQEKKVGDDPKREYFEKLGAEFAVGFFAGTKVDHFDSIDLYNCLHREPSAVYHFYHADEEMKYALQRRDESKAVKALDELIGFLAELVMTDYPHSHVEVCKEFQDREA
jgi:hypothetical protein